MTIESRANNEWIVNLHIFKETCDFLEAHVAQITRVNTRIWFQAVINISCHNKNINNRTSFK